MAYEGRVQYTGTIGLNLKPRLIFRTQLMRQRLQDLWDDDEVMLKVSKQLAKAMEPFVPKSDYNPEDNPADDKHKVVPGSLRASVKVTSRRVSYSAPYAHYMYYGIVYEDNIPVFDKNGNLVRFVSIAGQSKIRSDPPRKMNYTTPGTSDHWDKAMLKDKEAAMKFRKAAGRIITREWRKRYGR